MIKKLLASTAAAGLVVAPIAAQAGTRAIDAGVSIAPVADAMARQASPVGESEQFWEGIPEWLLVFLFALIAAGIIIVIEHQEDDATPGTGG